MTTDINPRTKAINTGRVTAGKIASGAVTEAKIGTGAVSTTKLASKAATGPKIDEAAFKFAMVTGKNGAGACTMTGAKVGDKVICAISWTGGTDAASLFESTITVADQLQQSSASDLHASVYLIGLLVKS